MYPLENGYPDDAMSYGIQPTEIRGEWKRNRRQKLAVQRGVRLENRGTECIDESSPRWLLRFDNTSCNLVGIDDLDSMTFENLFDC